MMRRGQAAMEYLVTYGWAFLIILVAMGALAYFGVLNPSNWVADQCDFGAQLQCVDFTISSAGNGAANLYLLNNFGKNITISAINLKKEDGTRVSAPFTIPTATTPNTLGAGQKHEVTVTFPANGVTLTKGDKERVRLIVTFFRQGVPTSPHNVTGTVYGRVQ